MRALFQPLLRQSLSSGGIYLLIIALSLAISATTALKFSHQQITQAVHLQASELLGGDLSLQSPKPLTHDVEAFIDQSGLEASKVTVFSSMAHNDDNFVMVNVKAIDQAFPLRGQLKIEHLQTAAEMPKLNTGEVWLSPRVFDLLDVKLGDSIQIADARLKITAKIVHDSNQETGFSGFSPTVMIHQQDIATTNAVQVGSRIDYRVLMAGEAQQVSAAKTQFNTWLAQQPKLTQEQYRLRDASEGNSRLMRPIENLDTFLNLANILTILLCGLAIALTSQRFLEKNQEDIALLRCLGATKQQLLSAFLALMATVAVLSTMIGAVVGLGLGYVLLNLMLTLMPHLQLQFSGLSMLAGPLPIAALTSVIMLIGFMLPHLWRLIQTSPVRVLRHDAQQLQQSTLALVVGVVSITLFCILLTERVVLSVVVIAAILLVCDIMYTLVWLLLSWIKTAKTRAAAYVRQPKQSAIQITALALGLSLISILTVLKGDLLDRWQQQLPEGTPNQFVYGLPPFDKDALEQQIQQHAWPHTELYPNIRGRLLQKNGADFSNALVEEHNALRRELNLTQAMTYPENNRVVAGEAAFSAINQVSVEKDLAERLGIQIGDMLTFSIPEGEIEAKVINLRTVEWESFSPNFFFIFSPKSMDAMSGSYLGSFYVPEQDQPKLLQLIQQFSNTVFIDVSAMLDEVKRLVTVLTQIIQILAWLVGVSGVLVLIACLNLMLEERKREVALFRSFGLSKAQLKRMMTIELGMIGLIAGVVACAFAEVIGAVVSWRMQLPIQWHPEIWLILPLCMMCLAAIIGRYRLGYLLDIPPLQSLGRGQ